MPGYVRSERDKVDHPALLNPIAHALFDWLFHKAARKPVKVNWRGHTIALKRGEVAFSLSEWISKRSDFDFVTRKRVRLIIERFVREDMITVGHIHASIVMQSASEGGQGGAKVLGQGRGQGRGALGMLIRVCNYDRYQAELAAKSAPRGQGLGQAELAIGAKVGPTERDSRDSRPESVTTSESLFENLPGGGKARVRARGDAPNGSRSPPQQDSILGTPEEGQTARAGRIKADFEPAPYWWNECVERLGSNTAVRRELKTFLARQMHKPETSRNWSAAFYGWCDKQEKFEHRHGRESAARVEAKRSAHIDHLNKQSERTV